WFESASMLAVALYLMPGTAICYQGEEIGMTNVDYQELSMFKDVEVFTEYQNMLAKGLSHEHIMTIIRARCRDNARSPMQWSEAAYGGFSKVSPWMPSNGNYLTINVKNQLNQPTSILSLYQHLLNQRLSNENITHGKITFLDVSSQKDFSYLNTGTTEEYLVLCNFTSSKIMKSLNGLNLANYSLIYNNYFTLQNLENEQELLPYESQVWKRVISQ
ncbi:MAG: alpha-amylase family glycosyl hydrolase, partial [Candidatus Izemoplasmatales bacterium]|nr:alpha-amylase family glycosyl hydrolase [Candidatus Izemoplasmatales bacterium]